ncbi:AraC family transcriptional regulator [Pseudohoeflea suaedae]|uniref:AraC family transcriptional regulator n=1 Tax=Pseudohoeflea suaedae TaxID=877384 RepID=A0A4R5PQS1_9HYPH|nr:AraC family transcriptional regulator [Pseudohoeflea suaedae]TDH39308.1 AraC family transcriptional regulator [Pseudohoeflea suaedae]
MSYQHNMFTEMEGIRAVGPARWRAFDGGIGVFWNAMGENGAHAYYLSPDPRIVIFFDRVSGYIRMANEPDAIGSRDRPMTRAVYVPAGVPLWTRFTAARRFSHLDLHIHPDRLLRYMTPSLGRSAAMAVLRRPVEIEDLGTIETLANLVVDDLSEGGRHTVYVESLVGAIAAALLDLPECRETQKPGGRLTQAQLNKLFCRFDGVTDKRLPVSEMASIVGLSESWFTTVFRQTTGKTPLQWQLARRIEAAQRLLHDSNLSLAEIAAQLGFSDQAHLTKAFRQVSGNTPAAWRRARRPE